MSERRSSTICAVVERRDDLVNVVTRMSSFNMNYFVYQEKITRKKKTLRKWSFLLRLILKWFFQEHQTPTGRIAALSEEVLFSLKTFFPFSGKNGAINTVPDVCAYCVQSAFTRLVFWRKVYDGSGHKFRERKCLINRALLTISSISYQLAAIFLVFQRVIFRPLYSLGVMWVRVDPFDSPPVGSYWLPIDTQCLITYRSKSVSARRAWIRWQIPLWKLLLHRAAKTQSDHFLNSFVDSSAQTRVLSIVSHACRWRNYYSPGDTLWWHFCNILSICTKNLYMTNDFPLAAITQNCRKKISK